MDTSLIDVDVQPTYIRVMVKGKVSILLLLEFEINNSLFYIDSYTFSLLASGYVKSQTFSHQNQ